jgi:predicted DNA binding CopG/RHH family protein
MSTKDIVEFLENFRELQSAVQSQARAKSRLISIKIPEDLLEAFRKKSALEGVPYQTQIKKLMKEWL